MRKMTAVAHRARLTATGKPRCLPRIMTKMITTFDNGRKAPHSLNRCYVRSFQLRETACSRKVVIAYTQTQADRSIGRHELEDDVEDREPGRVGFVV
jgi:hypothetical protein